MAPIDYAFIFGYLIIALGIALWQRQAAGSNSSQYFLAGRNLPWWWVGTSMVATTFAADTPLAITGLIYSGGIKANWLWFSWAVSYVLIFVFFAKLWRKSNVLTDVEFTTLRYGAEQAKHLRKGKAIFLGVIINLVILGWVFKAMSKISSVFFSWESILGESTFSLLQDSWPKFLLLQNLDNTLTIYLLLSLVLVYTSLGGLRSVMVTDLLQFVLAMAGSIYLAVVSVSAAGGFDQLLVKLTGIKAADGSPVLQLFFSFDAESIRESFYILFIFFLIQPLTQYYSDGTGYLAQRLNSSRSEEDSQKAGWFFVIVNFAVRTWPWIVVALASMVVLNEKGMAIDDPELAYPMMMKELLPAGALGLVLIGLLAAFMSTVDTHLNWGASYLTNDFLNLSKDAKRTVRSGRLLVLLLGIASVLVAAQMDTIAGAWKFLLALGAGLGVAQLFRWFWWRMNASAELLAISASFLSTVAISIFLPETRAETRVFASAAAGVAGVLIGAFYGKPVAEKDLSNFIAKLSPVGFWKNQQHTNRLQLRSMVAAFFLALVQVYSALLTPGFWLQGSVIGCFGSLFTAIALYWPIRKLLKNS